VHAAVLLEVNKPKPVVLFELAKGWLTGKRAEPGQTHELQEPHRIVNTQSRAKTNTCVDQSAWLDSDRTR
jgi:hypothetical protein